MRHAAGLLVASVLLAPVSAHAAGGADVVDDAFVETPGTCHLESWFTGGFAGGALEHFGIGCTPRSAPLLELDTAVEHASGGRGATLFAPEAKYTLLTLPAALSLGVSGTMVLRAHGDLAGAALTVPISITLGRYTALNLDLGYQFTRNRCRRDHHALFWGAQIARAVAPHFALIGEVYGASRGSPGAQGGVRWSPGPQRVDIDLRLSTGPAGAGRAATLGITLRF